MVEINLDKSRRLHFDTNALIAAEQALGKSIGDISLALVRRPSLEITRAMLWAGLLHEDPKLTIDAVGGFIKPRQLKPIWEKLIEAANQWFGEDDSPSPLADSPGASSGPSPASISG